MISKPAAPITVNSMPSQNGMGNFNFINGLPGLLIAKDAQSKYLSISQDFAALLGWKSSTECHGKTDYDIPCNAVAFAEEFISMDRKVIRSGVKMLALDIQNYSSGLKLVLVERNPVRNKELNVVGLFNQCIDVSNAHQFRAHYLLYLLDGKFIGKNRKPTSYMLNHFHGRLKLTEKQECCLFLLVRGKTAKEIAAMLNISQRTVEDRIETIKEKLKCRHKSELIEKAIDIGFLYYIPNCLQGDELHRLVDDNHS